MYLHSKQPDGAQWKRTEHMDMRFYLDLIQKCNGDCLIVYGHKKRKTEEL